jgi:hypothetical protein
MKRWAGLLALFLLAAIGAVMIAPRFQPSDLERRHAKVRPGMTVEEVTSIMHPDRGWPNNIQPGEWTWAWRVPRRVGARKVRLLEVEFDNRGRVIRTTVDGEPLRP